MTIVVNLSIQKLEVNMKYCTDFCKIAQFAILTTNRLLHWLLERFVWTQHPCEFSRGGLSLWRYDPKGCSPASFARQGAGREVRTFGGDGEQAGADGARAVSHDGDVGAVAAEVGDVVLQPGERRALVVQGEIGER